MKLSKLMDGIELFPDFQGVVTADDYVLAVGFGGETEPDDYVVAQEGITEHSGTMSAQTTENTYIRGGAQSTKTGTTRTISISGHRYVGDAFQDALLDHKLKYGTGQSVIKPYVYFCKITGKGEKGMASIVIEEDPSGAAGNNAGIKATLTARGTPREYTYSAKAATAPDGNTPDGGKPEDDE